MDLVRLYGKSSIEMERFIDGVRNEDLEKQSVDAEWSIRDLINHIVSETLWMPELLSGKTILEVGDKYDGDVLGDDFKKAYRDASKKANNALKKPGALEGEANVSWGKIPKTEYVSQMLLDSVIHGWDVLKSSGQNDELDAELVKVIYDQVLPKEEELRGYGVFGEKVEVLEDAPLQDRLLGILGRKR